MSDAPAQTQFDWSKDSAECVEGLKFDLDTTYNFIMDNFSKHDMVRKDGSKVLYKSGDKKGQPVLMYTAEFKEVDTKVKFKLDYFVSDAYKVNENAPETEDDFVRFSRKMGYSPVLGGRFSVADFIHLGTKISAKLKAQPLTDEQKKAGKKAYNIIDIDSIVLDGEAGESGQQEIPDEVAEETIEELQAMINSSPKCKKFADLASKINKAKKLELLEPAMQANQTGKLKF